MNTHMIKCCAPTVMMCLQCSSLTDLMCWHSCFARLEDGSQAYSQTATLFFDTLPRVLTTLPRVLFPLFWVCGVASSSTMTHWPGCCTMRNDTCTYLSLISCTFWHWSGCGIPEVIVMLIWYFLSFSRLRLIFDVAKKKVNRMMHSADLTDNTDVGYNILLVTVMWDLRMWWIIMRK